MPQRPVLLFVLLALTTPLLAQRFNEPGHSIGKISVQGELIVMELDEKALGTANMFDLAGHTLHLTPEAGGYRVENLPLAWDADFGPEHRGGDYKLQQFQFPFSGKQWDTISIGVSGSIRFGPPQTGGGANFGGGDPAGARVPGGVVIARFDQLGVAARNLVNTVPAICVFFKQRMSGPHYVREAADRAVVTWDITEPWGNIQDFTWTKTPNRFQAVLHKDGAIDLSYQELTAKDAIVGVYPLPTGAEKPIATLARKPDPKLAAHLDLRSVKLAAVDGAFLKVTFETRGPVLAEGDANLVGVQYRVHFDTHSPLPKTADAAKPDVVWTIRGFTPPGRNGGSPRYFANGPGVSGAAKVSGNTISVQGTLPPALRDAQQVAVYADVVVSPPGPPNAAAATPAPTAQVPLKAVKLAGIKPLDADLSALTKKDGPFPIVYESFHYLQLPNPRDLTCTVIKALGDKFDMLAYYSDFRVDNQEAGTPSTGPLGSTGPAVTGIGAQQRGLDTFCSAARFQWQFIQPVYVGSNQMQEYPPADAPIGNNHDVTFYAKQLGERALDGKMSPYNYGMSQIGHEMGHRWGAFVSAKAGNETIQLGPTHWARGLQAAAAFPYQRPSEASAMGGGVWQDNFDGTYTQLDDDYYVPAMGWSHLDLYLMGLIGPEEVPDFFILRNLQPAGRDPNGHAIFKADRTKVTINDVIAVEGPRTPDVMHSQRDFNTGIVVVVEHGKTPSKELLERSDGIRRQWEKYWAITTGNRSTMTTHPR